MKKLLLSMFLTLVLVSVVKAEDPTILKQFGFVTIYKPATVMNLVSLYDAWNGQGLWGAESPEIGLGDRVRINWGVMATTPQAAREGDGNLYYSIDYDMLKIYPTILNYLGSAISDLRVGAFAGYSPTLIRVVNGKESEGSWRAGIKASFPLW